MDCRLNRRATLEHNITGVPGGHIMGMAFDADNLFATSYINNSPLTKLTLIRELPRKFRSPYKWDPPMEDIILAPDFELNLDEDTVITSILQGD